MILNNNKYQNNPPESDIKFILKLFNSNKFIDAKKEIDKKIIKYPYDWEPHDRWDETMAVFFSLHFPKFNLKEPLSKANPTLVLFSR